MSIRPLPSTLPATNVAQLSSPPKIQTYGQNLRTAITNRLRTLKDGETTKIPAISNSSFYSVTKRGNSFIITTGDSQYLKTSKPNLYEAVKEVYNRMTGLSNVNTPDPDGTGLKIKSPPKGELPECF
jgi:hypothetical protein